MYPYNHKLGQEIQTNVEGISANRAFNAHINVPEPEAQSITAILGATALSAAAQEITTGITNPDVPRSVKLKANASGVAGDVVVHGTNMADEEISETLALNGTTEVLGSKAFKTITQIDLPAETHEGTDTVSVGTANKLGLPYLLAMNTVLKAYRGGTLETTDPTVATSTSAIESNTVLLDSALNGTDVDVYLMV